MLVALGAVQWSPRSYPPSLLPSPSQAGTRVGHGSNPLSPNISMQILLIVLHNSYGISWENLLKHQDVSSLVIVSLILMTSCIIMNIIY